MTTSTNPTQDELPILVDQSALEFYFEACIPEVPEVSRIKMARAIRGGIEAHTQQAVREALLSILNDPVLDLNYYTHEGAPSENLNAQEGGEQIVATSVVEYIESKLQEDI